ncbi:hypothetical protein Tco_0967039 [Tanacetum coccineum]
MSTPVFVDPKSSTQADGAQSSRVPTPFPEDPYEAISARSTSSDSTTPLSPDHPLTHTSPTPTPTPTRASFHCRTARMTVRAQLVMSLGHSDRVAEAMDLSDSSLRKRYRSSYEKSSSSSSPALPVQKRYRGTSKLISDTDSEEDEIREEDTDEDKGHGLDDEGHGLDDEGHGLDDEGHRLDYEGHGLDDEGRSMESDGIGLEVIEEEGCELAGEEDQVYSTFEIGQGSGSVPEPERPERVSALRQPTLTTCIDLEDGIAYVDIPAYPPPAPSAQTPPSPEWSFGLLPVSPAPSAVPLPISFRSLELEQERTVVTFGALWRPMLALEAWAGHVDTRMNDMSHAGYDDHRLVHDMSSGELEETPLEGTNSLEGQCMELGNGTSLWMIMVERFELNFGGEIPLKGLDFFLEKAVNLTSFAYFAYNGYGLTGSWESPMYHKRIVLGSYFHFRMVMKSFGAFREVTPRLAEIVTQRVPARQ